MQSFPMFFKTSGRRVVIVGGGEQAAQKTRLILKTDAEILLLADELDAELQGIVRDGRARHDRGAITPESFQDTALTFVATGCAGADAAIHTLAKAGGTVVNVVDKPDLCDVITPAIVDRDPVVVAIGTEGTAPVLGRNIKTQIEALLPQRLGLFAALAGRLRGAVARSIPQNARRAFWAWAFNGAPAALHRQGLEEAAAKTLKEAISDGRVPAGAGQGHIALVGAGPGARDLLTLRAVERLQEADVIFYDRLAGEDALELARRDAERVFVGKEVGACAWPQDKISSLIVAEAKKGRRVVRLKSGDPAIFGRATEELEAAQAAGIAIEIVPGVTAASAAAAATTKSLTERGASDAVVLVTGQCKPGDPDPDWAHHMRAGTTIAVYMGVRAAARISRSLLDAGAAPETEVEIVQEASTDRQRVVTTSIGSLATALAEAGIEGVATMIIRFPKTQRSAIKNAARPVSVGRRTLAVVGA